MEKVFELVIKGKLRLHQLAEIYPAEIIVPLLLMKPKNYGKTMNPGKELLLIFFGRDQ